MAGIPQCCFELLPLLAVNMAQPVVAARQHSDEKVFKPLDVVVKMLKQAPGILRHLIPRPRQDERLRAPPQDIDSVASSTVSGCEPNPDSTGIWRVSEAHNESKV